MLARLSIRDVVLIEQLDLAFGPGFAALTGETGAGKSILLDALGLALGARSDQRLVRHGAEQAVVTAAFEIDGPHPVTALLAEHGLDAGGPVIVRRILAKDGRSRAYVNDQPSTVGMLREIGALLVEIQGQAEQHTLMDPAHHRAALDAFAGLGDKARDLQDAWQHWREAASALDEAARAADTAAGDEAYLRHALGELEALDPKTGEHDTLTAERQRLMHREKLVDALNAALADLSGARPVEAALRAAQRQIDRVAAKAAGALDPASQALDRAAIEVNEAVRQLELAGAAVESESNRLQAVDDRLFALRDQARKHRVDLGALPRVRDEIAARLAAIVDGSALRIALEKRAAEARGRYLGLAKALSEARRKAAVRLDAAIGKELPPLKLDKARFATRLDALDEPHWGGHGIDRATFEIATNPGAPFGPIGRIASGGELSRFMLALKVVLAKTGSAPTLVFDEVDSGIGGATAAAVGERLARLGRDAQVLVVTHSPQVAARSAEHWRVEKSAKGKTVRTVVAKLAVPERREEIARMLSGKDITDEARRAADALMAGAGA